MQRDILVSVGKTTSVDVRLEVGGVEEQVTVTGEAPLVDVTSKEVGGNITSRELIDLPTVNRNFIGFVGLLPGIVPNISNESFGSDSISVNGQDSRYNNYLLDGANNNDDVIGQRAGTQARTAIESIQEFQVLTGQFDAEFGRTTGAVINAVTKQGTNQFRGSAFGFFQDAALTKRDYFAERDDLDKLEDTFSWFVPGKRGDHDVKFGLQYQYSSQRFTDQGGMNGTFSFPTNGPFDPTDPSSYPERFSIRVPGGSNFYQGGHNMAAFAQDKWRMNSKLTLSLGLRYDVDILPLLEVDNPMFTDPHDYPVDRNNVGPRLGFSYDLLGDGKTVLRGGYGLFYNSTRIGQVSGYINDGVFSDSFTAPPRVPC